jgi:hypothetical protein
VALQAVALPGPQPLSAGAGLRPVRAQDGLPGRSVEGHHRARPGPASELTQAQKNQQQAELALATTQDFLKSTDAAAPAGGRSAPPPAALAAVLARLPELAALQKDPIEAQDVAQASAQALAARRLAEAVAAGQKPQAVLSGRRQPCRQRATGRLDRGVQLSIPLFNAQDEPQRAPP